MKAIIMFIFKISNERKKGVGMRKQIGIADISRFASRLIVFEKSYYANKNAKEPYKNIKCARYTVNGRNGDKVQSHFIKGKKHEEVVKTVSLRELYPNIKHVYDSNGVLIARRNGLGKPLLITGKGFTKYIRTK
ncbi:type IV conjugative transfer system protein TraE [Enterococcus alishanensis]